MKVSDQFKMIRYERQVQHHRMLNTVAAHIQQRLEAAVPGLQLQLGGKSTQASIITVNLSGTVPDDDDTNEKMRAAVDALKNTNLL